MNILLLEQVSKLIEPLGWVLVHFLWQGTLIACALYCLLLAQQRASATARYCSTLAALVAMTTMPFVTLAIPPLSRPFPETQIFSSTISPQQESLDQPEPIADLPVETIAETSEAEPALELPTEEPNIEVVDHLPAAVPAQPQQISFSERMRQAELQLRPWLKGVVTFWLMGVLLLSIRLVRLWNRVQRLRRVGIESVPDDMLSRLEELACRLGIRLRVNLLLSKLVEVPTLIGWLQPVILFPATAVTGLTPSQLDAILVHELAHICRHDYLVNLLQSTVETLLFYHPAVWWISNRIRIERENCCDDLTVSLLGDPVNYGRALLALEELRRTTGTPALALGSQGGSLLGRIERLVISTQQPIRRSSMGTSLSVLVGSLMLGGFLLLAVRADEPDQQAASKTSQPDEQAKTTPDPQIEIRLPSGERFSLLRVGRFPRQSRPWRSGSGEVLTDKTDSMWMPGTHWEKRRTQIPIPNLDHEFQLEVECPAEASLAPRQCHSERAIAENEPIDGQPVQSSPQKMVRYRVGMFQTLSPEEKTTTLLIDYSNSPWEHLLTVTPEDIAAGINAAGKNTETSSGNVSVESFKVEKGRASVVYSHPLSDNEIYQGFLIDETGTGYVATGDTGKADGKRRSVSAEFSFQAGTRIKGIRIQRRQMQHIEFRNVSLLPNEKTDVEIYLDGKKHSADATNDRHSDASPSWKDHHAVARVGKTEIQIGDLYLSNANLFKEFRQDVEELEKQPSSKERDDILTRKRGFLVKEIKQALAPAIEGRLFSLAMQDYLQTFHKEEADELENQFRQGVWIPPKSYFEESGEDFNRYFQRQLEWSRANFYYKSMIPLTIFHDVPRLKEYHQAHLSDFSRKPKVRWQAISIRSSNHEGMEPARHRAEEAFEALSSGSSFEDAARKYSDSVTASSGGYKGWITEGDITEESLKKLLFELPVNETSTVTPVSDGWMIVKVLEREPLTLLPFDECKGEVKLAAEREIQLPIYRKLIAESEQKHPVKVFYGDWKGPTSGLASPFESWLWDEVKVRRAEENNPTDGLKIPIEDSRHTTPPQGKPARESIPDQSDLKSILELDLKEETVIARVADKEITAGDLSIPGFQIKRKIIEDLRRRPTTENLESIAKLQSELLNDISEHGLISRIQYQLQLIGLEEHLQSLNPDEATALSESLAKEYEERVRKAELRPELTVSRPVSISESNETHSTQRVLPERIKKMLNLILRMKRFREIKTGGTREPTEEELRSFFESPYKGALQTNPRVKWQYVLIKDSQHGGRDASKLRAEEALTALKSGKRFDEVAEKYSDSVTASEGGHWGWSDRGSLSNSQIDNLLFEIPIGEISQIQKVPEGWQIVKVLERQQSRRPPFEECRGRIRDILYEKEVQREQKEFEDLERHLKKTHEIWTIFGDMESLRQQADTQNRAFLQDQFIEPHDYLPQAIWSSNVRGLRFSIDALRDDTDLLKDEELPQSGWRVYARWKNVSDQPITLKYIPVRSTLKVDRGKSEFVAVIPLMPNPAKLQFNPFSGPEIKIAPGEIINCPITYLQINTLNKDEKIPVIDEAHSPISLPPGNYTLQVDHTFQDSEINGLESIIFQATTALEVQEGKPAEIRVSTENRKIEGT